MHSADLFRRLLKTDKGSFLLLRFMQYEWYQLVPADQSAVVLRHTFPVSSNPMLHQLELPVRARESGGRSKAEDVMMLRAPCALSVSHTSATTWRPFKKLTLTWIRKIWVKKTWCADQQRWNSLSITSLTRTLMQIAKIHSTPQRAAVLRVKIRNVMKQVI